MDLCPGDGALALAAYKRGICYTGLCFSDAHKQQLQADIERSIFQAMSNADDMIYEPRLVAFLQDEKTEQQTAKAKVKPTPKPKVTPSPAPTPAAKALAGKRKPEDDEVGDEADMQEDDHLSGDAE